MKFKASLGRTALIVTLGIITLFIVLSWAAFFGLDPESRPGLFPFALMWIVILLCFVLRPRYYIVYEDRIIIKRLFRSVTIPRNEIRLCRTITEKELGPLIRVFGVGGLFGYFGKFFSSSLGAVRLYATQQHNLVLLYVNKDRKILLSPDEPAAFTRKVSD